MIFGRNLLCVWIDDFDMQYEILRWTTPHLVFETADFPLRKTPFSMNMLILGIRDGNSTGESLIGFYPVVKSSAVGVMYVEHSVPCWQHKRDRADGKGHKQSREYVTRANVTYD